MLLVSCSIHSVGGLAYAVLLDLERSAAVADWDCTQSVQGEMQLLRYGYEALFLDEQQGRINTAVG
jgi:hypothetical protein